MVKRGADGAPETEKTPGRGSEGPTVPNDPPGGAEAWGKRGSGRIGVEDATTPIRRGGLETPTQVIIGGGRGAGSGGQPSAAGDDPVTGVLVIVRGPGAGKLVALGHGHNTIGRSPGARIPVDFGDAAISHGCHFSIAYDPRGRTFYITHGGGKNFVYLQEKPVLSPEILQAGALVQAGETTFRFLPVCGPDFDWAEAQ